MEFCSTGVLKMAAARRAKYRIWHRQKLCVQVFPLTRMCRKCPSSTAPKLPYSGTRCSNDPLLQRSMG
jgi:hypothetical protein